VRQTRRMLRRYQQSFVSFLLVLVSGKALALSTLNYSSSSSPIVTLQVPYGSFQGKVVGDLVAYLGIPFAAPPYVNAARQICNYLHVGAVLVNIDLGSQNLLYLSMGFVKQQLSEPHVLNKMFHLTLT